MTVTAKELEEKHRLVVRLPEGYGEARSFIVDNGALYAVTDSGVVIQMILDCSTGMFVGREL